MQPDQPLVVQVDQQSARGATEQGVGIRDDGNDQRGSAREDFAVEIRTELTEGTAPMCLFAALPSEHGRLQDASLIADLLVQGDVTGFDARHDVRTGYADQVGRFLGAEHGVGICDRHGLVGGAGRPEARVLEQANEVAFDDLGKARRQVHMPAYHVDERIDLYVHVQWARGLSPNGRLGNDCAGNAAGRQASSL